MDIQNFYAWKDHTSLSKLNKADPRPYIHDIEISSSRGAKKLWATELHLMVIL